MSKDSGSYSYKPSFIANPSDMLSRIVLRANWLSINITQSTEKNRPLPPEVLGKTCNRIAGGLQHVALFSNLLQRNRYLHPRDGLLSTACCFFFLFGRGMGMGVGHIVSDIDYSE